ncbi:CPBP family intramembrane glutamic endopeptidase [Lacticaseibacillus baoqingensis]|uniref:CPBP family intramembrane glutamic endopeptidase n=1 Tax=Lacticaseibacillus baoqingensis TaxID=2486013 RepID=A0ABW4E430_9LACO|nr:CPBP family intramembrane glutamic endopeptidase [Lacticaseibacillus baoqingensis]
MTQLKWGWRVLLGFGLELALGEFAAAGLAQALPLAALPTLISYKLLTILVVIGLNAWLLKQRLFWAPLAIGTFGWVLILWLLIGGATLQAHGIFRVISGIVIGACAALPEELFCRGVLFGQLLFRWPRHPRRALGASAGLFAAMHLINLTHQSAFLTGIQMVQVFGLGVLLAALYLRSGTLWAPIAFHATLDFAAVAIHGSSGMPTGTTSSLVSGSVFWCVLYLIASALVLQRGRQSWRLLTKLAAD